MMGIPEILTIIFIILKLCGVITWSWWWVWSPFLFSVAVWFVIFTCMTASILANGGTMDDVRARIMAIAFGIK